MHVAGELPHYTKISSSPRRNRHGSESRAAEGIELEPTKPDSHRSATACYLYDNDVSSYVRGVTPCARGELEITDANNECYSAGVRCSLAHSTHAFGESTSSHGTGLESLVPKQNSIP